MKRSITGFGNMNNATLQIPVVSVSPSQPLTLHNMEAEFDPLCPHPHTHLHVKGEVMVKENFTLTEDMKFGEAHAIAILAYSIMFVVGLTTNTISLVRMMQVRISVTRMTVMVTMVTQERIQRKDRSKMTLLLIHLSVADLTVSKYDLQYVQSAGVKRTPLRINYGWKGVIRLLLYKNLILPSSQSKSPLFVDKKFDGIIHGARPLSAVWDELIKFQEQTINIKGINVWFIVCTAFDKRYIRPVHHTYSRLLL